MSQISSREKKLIGLICVLLFIFGNVIALRWWSGAAKELKEQQHTLDLALIEDEALFEQRAEWEQRKLWLDSSITIFPGRETADAKLLNFVQTGAKTAGLVVDSTELLEPPEDDQHYFARAGVRVRASGTFEQLAKWIHELQEPVDFRSLTNFELKNDDKKPGVVHCRFQCWEWSRKSLSKSESEVATSGK